MATTRHLVIALLVALASTAGARAAEVSVAVSSRHVYAEIPFTLTVEIVNAASYEMPELPEMDGIRALGEPTPSRRSETRIFNGRTTQKETVTITWMLQAERTGQVTIPAFKIRADDKSYESEAITLTATKPEAGDLLLVEIESARPTVYLGERVDLTLRIWIKPFVDQRFQVALGSEWMWSMVSIEGSAWGDFRQSVLERSGPRGFRSAVRGEERLREGEDGSPLKYYVFEFNASFVPQRAGEMGIQPVAVRMRYPTRLRRARSFFSRSDYEVDGQKVIAESATLPALEVKSPPAAGRPADYSGAVGTFAIDVKAQPQEVSVGDPITLTLNVYDRTPGGSRLDVLPPPALERIDDLNASFRVPDEPLAGAVDLEARRKTFTQTIRARRADVTEIPSIPFSFFDPVTEAYEVARSEPIPLIVTATTEVGMADVIGADGAGPNPAATGLTETAAGLLANTTDVTTLLRTQGFTPRWWHVAPVSAPPLLYAAILAGHRRSRRLRDDHGYARRRGARRTATRRLAEGAGSAEAVAAAVTDYIADRCNVPAGALTGAEATDRLRTNEVDAELTQEIETLLAECERAQYAGGVATDTATLTKRAEQCIVRLERERLR
ncbi:MAG: BatD family protein [Planctomycetota bacterium]|jgi:hypothetical protein